jgi:hypothetical protein
MAKPPAKKVVTKAAVKAGAKAVGKKLLPGYAVYATGKAVKEGRFKDAVGEAAWATIPTGIMYETAQMLPKETAKEAKARKSRNWKI